ncbi:N-acetylmuramoyl-L-alanine amidase [Bacillus infantis]|uniref:N-acetylmuramoyl-L-alanine amidase n=1 Tax=Bacillus infantis TaxID=324767 RepID=A0A5D4SWY8_9BACI|nr:N-acetylmuramoyl-L-alanine amidase [Bacillus infantis]TYS66386.1 N-acetylmuramoyl-L-alanine amidase [Bacillus infantis]
MVKFFIDPGHGGTDSGAVGNGLMEKILTLLIALRIRALLLQFEGVEVKMSREDDRTLSLKQRTDMANDWGADFYLSPHINAGGGTGYEDFRHNTQSQSSEAGRIQSDIHKAVMAEIKGFGVIDRGAKAANYHVLRESHMPAALTESLFIDKAADAALLKQDIFLDAIARGHVNGLVQAFNLKLKKPAAPTWDGMDFKKGQIGRVSILKPINLWKDDVAGKLKMERVLRPGNRFRVYGYRDKYGGQYDVGGGFWVTKMDGYIEYETPSKALLAEAEEFYK